MINNNITEQVTNFNYLGCQLSSNRNYDLQNKWQRFNYLCRTIKCALVNKSQQKTILKLYEVLAVPSLLLYVSEWWTFTKQQLQQIESSEIIFLRSVAGYRRMDTKRNTDIRQELNTFNLGEKVEYQWNYSEHILRMPTYQIPQKLFNYRPKGRRERPTTEEMERTIWLTRRLEQVKRPEPCSW
jgi:hypothetical protein